MIDTPSIFIADLRSYSIDGPNGKRKGGHYVPVASMYQQLFSKYCRVIVAGGPVYEGSFKKEELLVLPYNVQSTSLKSKWHTMKNAIQLFKAAKGKIIILQQATVVTSFIVIALFYRNNSRLYTIQYSDEGVRTLFRRLIFRLMKHKLKGIICPSEIIGKAYGIPYLVVPDYIYLGKKDKNQSLAYSDKKYDFCMVGRISPEKGIIEVARKLKNTLYKVLIAGNPQTVKLGEELSSICKDASNITLHLGFIEDFVYKSYLRESRYSILNYYGEYSKRSSGVVLDVLFSGTPVVGRRCKALQFIEDLKLGMIVDNIGMFEPKDILSEKTCKEYQNHIEYYKQSQKKYQKEIVQFILR